MKDEVGQQILYKESDKDYRVFVRYSLLKQNYDLSRLLPDIVVHGSLRCLTINF